MMVLTDERFALTSSTVTVFSDYFDRRTMAVVPPHIKIKAVES